MAALGSFVGYLAQVLVVVAAAHALVSAWRRRDAQRLDILAFLLALIVIYWANGPSSPVRPVAIALLAAQPLLLSRLVQHFTPIGWLTRAIASAAIPILTIGWIGWGRPWLDVLHGCAAIGVAVGALAFARESRRSSGLTRRRLVMASGGSGLFALAWALAATSSSTVMSSVTGSFAPMFTSSALICFFFTFSTPKRLATRWQREEQAKYLTRIAARRPEPRGIWAAHDLNAAATRGVSNALTFVAMRQQGRPDRLVVRAASEPSLIGLALSADHDLIARVVAKGAANAGPVQACQPELASRLAPFGARVLVAAIAADDLVFGVVGAVQRRGSLFPDDDLALLQAFGRHAGTALDHARLATEARDRAQRSARRKLVEVESRTALMLDSIKDYAIMIVDDAGALVSGHAGVEHLFGYGPAEMTDDPAAPLFAMEPEELASLLAEARQLGLTRREGPCRRRDGAIFHGVTVIRPLEADDEGIQGFVVVTQDVTARRALEDRLRQSQKMEAIGQLAGGIAHDFNNLLTAILGYSEWLARDIDPADSRRAHVDEIQKAAERAAGLTRQLLTFSRAQILQPEVLNLSHMVSEMLPMLRRLIDANVEVEERLDTTVSPILADPTQIEQVVLNLAVNARDAMPGGGRLSISIGDTWMTDAEAGHDLAPGPCVLLAVEDTGTGMVAETLAHIFEPFFTTKEPGRGTGLGLATVYGIVRQMGGAIRVRSAPAEGTTFRVYLPKTSALVEATPLVVVGDHSGTETILLVEDDAPVRQYLRKVLERHGYVVVEAADQVVAMSAVQAHQGPIDLIVSDVLMPRGTGPELVRALAQILPGVPALFISGYADVALARQVTFPKASQFLQKPFSANELLARITQFLLAKRQSGQ